MSHSRPPPTSTSGAFHRSWLAGHSLGRLLPDWPAASRAVQVTGQLSNQTRTRLDRLQGRLQACDQEQRADGRPGDTETTTTQRRRQRRLTAAQVAELMDAARKGAAVSQLVRRYGVHRSTVLDHLARPGGRRRPSSSGCSKGGSGHTPVSGW